MPSYSSREIIKLIETDGWFLVNTVGSHHQFKHPTKKGSVRVTVPHPKKDLPRKTMDNIMIQAGLE
ncbi:type II toxin-antitoxin system HicA family toxin [Paenibacillus sp. MER TA 81-3]|uniref:type II toxin-antitoxin system HicA family toxin n=1 Tax=Paenibacillus sp. MER TA 81-3 TaxID=2939573 RepID=UPI00203AD85C|nr:type II toxin-antitoxin system HicA family toxin [Paenibacillus sp. MER TA 81-3]MCM3340278.1 type II toxin-antitoxin system HicA family toxin [Paenibacillus sp. MER TA 81-3]